MKGVELFAIIAIIIYMAIYAWAEAGEHKVKFRLLIQRLLWMREGILGAA